MQRYDFSIPIFDVDVTLLQVESKEDLDAVLGVCGELEMHEDNIKDISDTINDDCYDGADTYWCANKHYAVCVFYPMKTDARKRKCYAHEKRHVEDRVLKSCGIDDQEAAGYLAGYLEEEFHKLYVMKNDTNQEHIDCY